MTRSNPSSPKCPVCQARKLPATLLCDECFAAFDKIKAAPGENQHGRLYRLADWAIRRAVRLERKAGNDAITYGMVRERVARHALAEALLGIEATTVEEYRDRAHALVMNWKGEV